MSFRRVRVLFTLGLISSATALSAQTTAPQNAGGSTERATSLVVLRNGEILQGEIQASKNDRLSVRMPRGEISVRQAEVDVIAASLDDAYALKLAKIPPTDVDGHLDLAAWCVRHELLGNAASELTTAISIQPRNPRIAIVQRRLRQIVEQQQATQEPEIDTAAEPNPANEPKPILVEPSDQHEHQKKIVSPEPAAWPPKSPDLAVAQVGGPTASPRHTEVDKDKSSKQTPPKRPPPRDSITEIERLVRTLPADAVEGFTSVAQPILVNGCATAGCHAPGNATTFTLLRLPQDRPVSRRLTQRNLYNVVQLVDFKKPAESTLFNMAKEPHGPLKTPALGQPQSAAYRELIGWVAQLTRSNLDEMLPTEVPEQQPAIADRRSPNGSARQSLMRRMRAPSVSTARTPHAPGALPKVEHAGLTVSPPQQPMPPVTNEQNPQATRLPAYEEPIPPSQAGVQQAGLIAGTPPERVAPQSGEVQSPENGLLRAAPPASPPSSLAQSQSTPAPAQVPKASAANPNGITAVDRFLAFKGALRVTKEIQTPAKPHGPNSKANIKQPPASSEPDPYDLMRFVKEK